MEIDYSEYKILVVDDVPSNVLLLRLILEQEKFQILSAQDGLEALDLATNGNDEFDLILLDIMMPHMDGFELTQRFRSMKKYASVPILFLTALNSTENIVKGFELGANDYITKPFNRDELLMRVKHQISLIEAKRRILKQAEDLKAAIVARDRLYSVVAHDLRTPVATLKMLLSVLSATAREKNVDEECTEMLDAGAEISEQVFCLLDNLLKWAKGQSGLIEPIFELFNLSELAEAVTEVAAPLAKTKKIALDLQLDPDVVVSIDTDMVKSIIRNLIFNALKFSYPESTITVRVKKTQEEAIVEVQDNGCGISKEHQELLRSQVSRFSTYGTNNEEGTGLGLIVSYHFVELHRGKFSFDSEEGKGSCFRFSLPLHK